MIKARLVLKGFEEESPPADSPTASRYTFKVFCTVTANQRWDIEGSDVRAVFLQSESLNRRVFIKPPKERQKT